jgi:phosphoglucosamine mutase
MKRFGTDGIRGRWGAEVLNDSVASALGHLLRERFGGPIPIVRDTRESGAAILASLEKGLGRQGMDYGVMPTPALSAILRDQGGVAGIAVTASHNPWEDNGLKVLGPGGGKLPPEVEAEIDAALGAFLGVAPVGGALQKGEGAEVYLAAQLRAVGDCSALAGTRIALDTAHGAAFETGPRLLAALGIDVHLIGAAPNGRNINLGRGALHPEALQAAVRSQGCVAGIGLDGDADRCTLVDSRGDVVHGDALLLLLAKAPGVVGTVMCNTALEVALRDRGLGFCRSSVGDRNVQIEMTKRAWSVGGEPSGHVLLADALPTGDGLVTGLRALVDGVDIQGRLNGWAPMPAVQVAVPVESKPPLRENKAIQALLAEAGTRLNGRILLRYSGTEPKLRILVEAKDLEVAQKWCDRLLAVIAH